MIGLGSNRLSVCRRGGMSVTQAGKGGMEWLGVRMPSWSTPYSAQATAALKAQFPTQWPTIRDYGLAHPALVPFINEDPMLVCSLIPELGVIRWLVGDGASYVRTEWKANQNFRSVAKIRTMSSILTGGVFSCGQVYDASDTMLIARSGQYDAFFWNVGGEFVNTGSAQLRANTVYNIDMNKSRVIINGTQYNLSSRTFTSPYKFSVMSRNGAVPGNNMAYNEHWNYQSGNLVNHLVPFIGRTMGDGMIDLADMTFHENEGTGAFTSLLTQQDGVTPWSPS